MECVVWCVTSDIHYAQLSKLTRSITFVIVTSFQLGVTLLQINVQVPVHVQLNQLRVRSSLMSGWIH